MKALATLAAFGALLFGSAVQSSGFTLEAPPETTGRMFLWCSNPTEACEAYVAAAYDSVVGNPKFCPPADLTHERILAEVIELIETTPELRDANAFTIINAYLLTVYGCAE